MRPPTWPRLSKATLIWNPSCSVFDHSAPAAEHPQIFLFAATPGLSRRSAAPSQLFGTFLPNAALTGVRAARRGPATCSGEGGRGPDQHPSSHPRPAPPRSGEGPGHLNPDFVVLDQGRPAALRARRPRPAASGPLPRGPAAGLAGRARGGGRGERGCAVTTPAEKLLSRLHGVKKAGRGWSARCPAHGDQKASLSVSEGSDGTALLKCHAGCSTDAVLAALGLKLRDLFPAWDRPPPRRNGKPAGAGPAFATAREALASLEKKLGKWSCLWTYHDGGGEPVGLVVRWDGPTGKVIRPLARHAEGWRVGAMPSPRPLYRLPELAAARRVIVCEGEKAADAARSLGFTATTSAGGAQAAEKADWRPLAGKEVWLFPDNDPAGRKYAEAVAGLLAGLTPAPAVRVLDLAEHAPQLPEGGDLADVLADGRWCGLPLGDAAGPADLAALLEQLAGAVEPWAPEAKPGPVLTCLADVAPRAVSWLWPGRIPLGRITLLVGRPGEGKSFVTLDAAARVSTGTPWPDGGACPRGSVLLLTAEDGAADTIRPRLDAHNADLKRVHLLSAVRRAGGKGDTCERLATLSDVDAVEAALARLADCKLVVVDPVGSFLGGQVDAHRDNEVRGVLAPLAALAEKRGPAVLVVAHRRKSAGGSADDLALGSRAFTGIARA